MTIQYRFAALSDATACNDFGNLHRNDNRALSAWKWEFAPDGRVCPFVVAFDGQRVVGTQAAIPTPLLFDEGVVASAKSEETMVDPAYRGRGIFEGMYELLLQRIEAEGVKVIWGFTPARKPFERIGFNVPTETQQIVFPLSKRGFSSLGSQALSKLPGRRTSEIASRPGWEALRAVRAVGRLIEADASIHVASDWTQEHHAFTSGVLRSARTGSIDRNVGYMHWRISRNPHARCSLFEARLPVTGALAGLALASSSGSSAYLVDFISDPARMRIAIRLLREVTQWAQSQGAEVLRVWGQGSNPVTATVRHASKLTGGVIVRRGFPMVVLPISAGSALPAGDRWYTSRLFTEGRLG